MTDTEADGTQTDTEAEGAQQEQDDSPGRRLSNKRILAALFWLLASLSIMVGSVTLWAHQSLLTSDGWARVVSNIASDPEVIENTSVVIVDRLSDSLGVSDRIVEILPGEMNLVAGAITLGLQERVAAGLADFAAREGVQDAFVNVNRAAHDVAMKVIRGGDSEVLTSEEGAITLNVFPLIEGALIGLQEAGLIDEDREIPNLSEYEPPAETVARLETLLGRDLPADIGTITLIESDNLEQVQIAVRNFDIITLALIGLAVLCVALALWLSARRVRMVLWLAIGAIAALALGRAFTRVIIEDITGSLGTSDAGVTVRAVVESAVESLMWFTFAIIVIALIVAGLSLWYERRSEPGESTSEETRPKTISERLREHARTIAYGGIGVIAFLVLWSVGGPDIALLAAAAVGIWLIAVSVLAGRNEDSGEAGEAAAEGGSS